MKKIKKIFAIVLAMAMVLGMSITAFATATENEGDSVSIPINGAPEGTSYQYRQLIEPDSSAPTGWKFSNGIETYFEQAFNGESDDQKIIWMLIKLEDSNNANIPSEITAATEDQVKAAITNVANNTVDDNLTSGETVNTAGMYYIRATKTGYAFNPMAAYVSFKYNANGIREPGLETSGVDAKYSKIDTAKTSDAGNNVTEIGRTVKYYVSSVVPFVPTNSDQRQYIVTDTISGARYNSNDSNELTLSIYYGYEVDEVKAGKDKDGNEITKSDTAIVDGVGKDATSFTADLTNQVLKTDEEASNDHANQKIVIVYEAVVTDTEVNNSVTIGDGSNDGEGNAYGENTDKLYTGQITITKVDAGDEDHKLEGAEFVISKEETLEGEETPVTKYAVFDENGKFVEWANDSNTPGTKITTDEDGTISVIGLAEGTYSITETKAPTGFSVNEAIDDVKVTANGTAASTVIAEATVKDTTLSSLPSTGGIGTTIFTICGCAIIVVAAGLFFASRRKRSA